MIQVAQANHTGNMADTIPPMGTREENWVLPVTRAVKAAVSEDPRRQVVYDYLANSWSYTHFADMGTMDSHLKTMISEIENGADTQGALDKAVDNLLNDM